jgi:hypothetical protein
VPDAAVQKLRAAIDEFAESVGKDKRYSHAVSKLRGIVSEIGEESPGERAAKGTPNPFMDAKNLSRKRFGG